MAGHHDPRVLYSIEGVRAYSIQNGQESLLTPSGPQTMSLLMVPTSSPFSDLSTTIPQNEIPEEDFYLHLRLPPELDLPLPATTQIYRQQPCSYLIPRWELGPAGGDDGGSFIRIELPGKASQDDIDTFETILAQCTAFMERAPPPTGTSSLPAYSPADWAAGGRLGGGKTAPGQLVLVDEDDGSVVGELAEGANIIEDPALAHGSKNPVEIQISQDGNEIHVRPVSDDYLRMAQHPAYRDSSLVQNAAAASRLIVTSSTQIGNILTKRADSFTQSAKPNPKPMQFGPAAHERVRKLHSFTESGANLSAKTLGQATKYAQNIGATIARRGERKPQKGFGADGQPVQDYKPGLLNKSMIAFSTIADGIAESGRGLLTQSGAAATTVVGHKYGPDAGILAGNLAGGVKNVGLVYIDVTGVTRRAVIKSVAKGMVVGKVRGGGDVVVGAGDGGVVPDQDLAAAAGKPGVANDSLGQQQQQGGQVGFGNAAGGPPAYSSGQLGEPMGGWASKEKNMYT